MLLIRCPYCEEERPELEFRNAGEAHVARPADIASISDEDFEAFFFIRSNPKGLIYERWRHIHGCGRFFNAARDTVSDRFFLTYKAGEKKPDPARFTRRVEAAQEVASIEAGAAVVEAARAEVSTPAPPRPAAPKPGAKPEASTEAPAKPAAVKPARKAAPRAAKKKEAEASAEVAKPARASTRKPSTKGEA